MSSSFRRRRPTAGGSASISSSASGTGTSSSRSRADEGRIQSTLQLRLPGTKPWTGGLTLTSSGLREIDAILGGGQPLGTYILLEEDRLTFDLGMCMARYWAAEAVAQGQTLVLPATKNDQDSLEPLDTSISLFFDDDDDDDPPASSCGTSTSELDNFVGTIPRDLHLDKFRSRSKKDSDNNTDAPDLTTDEAISDATRHRVQFAAIQEEDENDEDFDEDEDERTKRSPGSGGGDGDDNACDDGLQIAWQYRESVQRQRLGRSATTTTSTKATSSDGEKTPSREVYCHSYDLAGRMIEQHDASKFVRESGIDIVDCACQSCPKKACMEMRQCGLSLFRSLLKRVQHHLSKTGDDGTGSGSGVVRLLLLDAPPSATSVALPLLLSYARAHSLAVAVMVTVRPWLCVGNTELTSLRRTADAVFAFDGFPSFRGPPPPEFRELAGILTIRKIAAMGGGHFANATSGRRPPADRYGLKRDRRKLHVRLLHLPPEEESAGGSSTTGVRSGGGKVTPSDAGCGSGKGKPSSLDF